MKIHAKHIAVCIFAGFMAFSIVSASENNSSSQSTSPDWLIYAPLVGVIGTIIGIYSLLERRKDRARNARINEWLETNVNLSDLRKNLAKLEGDKRDAQYYLDNALSASIKNVALKERAKTQADLVVKSYIDYKLTIDKLKEISPETEVKIPESIKSDVLVNLVPEYEKQKEREALKDRVTVLSIALLIVNSVFDSIFMGIFIFEDIYRPIQWFGNAVFGPLLVFSFIQLARPQINEFDAQLKKALREGVRIRSFIAFIVLFLVGILFSSLGIVLFLILPENATSDEKLITGMFAIIGVLLCIGGGGLAYRSANTRIKLH